MWKFLRSVDSYFRERPTLFWSMIILLLLFLILTTVLAAVCPPAALAVGIGGASLIGKILPLIALTLVMLVNVGIGLIQLARYFEPSSGSDIVDVLRLFGETADLKVKIINSKNSKLEETFEQPAPEHYDSLFVNPQGKTVHIVELEDVANNSFEHKDNDNNPAPV